MALVCKDSNLKMYCLSIPLSNFWTLKLFVLKPIAQKNYPLMSLGASQEL